MSGGLKGDAGNLRVFAVILDDDVSGKDIDKWMERLTKQYPSHHQVNKRTFVVRTKHLASEVSQNVGISPEGAVASGVVFRLNGIYSGYTDRSLWDWLGEAE